MKERPILFSAPMVRALLAGTKTQTRRKMRDQVVAPGIVQMARPGYCEIINEHGVHIPGFSCPYGQPGDRLWVREAWAPRTLGAWSILDKHLKPIYRASEDRPEWKGIWKPSIHMPRWASRVTLQVTCMRVERLQDISEADARAEGVIRRHPDQAHEHFANPSTPEIGVPTARDAYRQLWESINGAGSWTANTWVWAIEFKRVEAA